MISIPALPLLRWFRWPLLALWLVVPVFAQETITIGALFSLSGDAASHGRAAQAVLQTAIEDFNQAFQQNPDRTPYKAQAILFDTKSDPQVALERLQYLASVGVKVVLGPLTSAELFAVKDYADQQNLMLISTTSTAPSLAIENDSVFRLTPDDTHQGWATAALMQRRQTKAVAVLHLDDLFGQELADTTLLHFIEGGGEVLGRWVFSSGTTDFSTILQQVQQRIDEAKTTTPSASIGIYVIGFDEIASLCRQAQAYPSLASCLWYGSDGTALSTALVQDAVAADYARRVCFINPVYGGNMTASPFYQDVLQRVRARAKGTPNAQIMAVYDAFHLITKAYLQANRATSLAALKREFVHQANSYTGITGSTVLNAAGDRVLGDYDFWNIAPAENGHSWVRTGIFVDSWGDMPDFIYFSGCPSVPSHIPSFLIHDAVFNMAP